MLREGHHNYLDTAGLVGLTDTCEECLAIVHHLDLVQVDALLELAHLDTVADFADRLVLTCGKD